MGLSLYLSVLLVHSKPTTQAGTDHVGPTVYLLKLFIHDRSSLTNYAL